MWPVCVIPLYINLVSVLVVTVWLNIQRVRSAFSYNTSSRLTISHHFWLTKCVIVSYTVANTNNSFVVLRYIRNNIYTWIQAVSLKAFNNVIHLLTREQVLVSSHNLVDDVWSRNSSSNKCLDILNKSVFSRVPSCFNSSITNKSCLRYQALWQWQSSCWVNRFVLTVTVWLVEPVCWVVCHKSRNNSK